MIQKTNSPSLRVRLLLFNVLIIFFLINEIIFAGDDPEKKIQSWSVNLSLGSYYDSNILKYSEKYLTRFLNGQDEGRFHIDSYDDFIFKYSASLIYSNRMFGNLLTIFGAGFDSDAYTVNSVKSWFTYDFFWRQYVSTSLSFLISYSHIPEYYVRHFRDEDLVDSLGFTPETFQPYEFTKDDFSFWVQNIFSWKTTRARLYFSYMRYFLNSSYSEYDSKDFLFGFRVFQRLTEDLDLNFGYLYGTSDATGFDEPGETKEISDDSDASNYEHTYTAGLGLRLPRIFSLSNEITLDAQYQRAIFTTNDNPISDPLHSGRYDNHYRVFINYNLDILNNLFLTVFYNWMGREASTYSDVNKQYVSNEKDYTQYRVGIRLNYLIKF